MPTARYSCDLDNIEQPQDDEEKEEARLAWVEWLSDTGRLDAISRYLGAVPFDEGHGASLFEIREAMDRLADGGFNPREIHFIWIGDRIHHEVDFPERIANSR